MFRLTTAIFGLSLLGVIGCGGSGYTVARVKGKVTCNGQPVKEASIMFSPVGAGAGDQAAGKAANGRLDDNGEFVLGTYSTNDGAVVGKHRVAISFENPYKKLPCQAPTDLVLEVKNTENHFDIELASPPKK